MTSTDHVRDAFVERLFASALGTMDVFTVYLGDRLGLYRMLAAHGPRTAGEPADRAGIYARYAREWLEQQSATGIVEVDDAEKPEQERRFSLPAGHAEALIDPESPYAMAALCRSLAALGGVLPKLVDAYRTGEGVAVEGATMSRHRGTSTGPGWWARSPPNTSQRSPTCTRSSRPARASLMSRAGWGGPRSRSRADTPRRPWMASTRTNRRSRGPAPTPRTRAWPTGSRSRRATRLTRRSAGSTTWR